MRRLPLLLLLAVVALAALVPVDAKPHGIVGATGGCTPCHGTQPDLTVTPLIGGLPSEYAPGATYTLTLRVEGGPPINTEGLRQGGHAGGFDLFVTDGFLRAPAGSDDVMISVKGGTYHDPTAGHVNVPFPPSTWGEATFQHPTQAAPMAGANKRVWDVEWKAPPQGTGPVTFQLAAMAVNGDHRNTTDDRWNTASFTVAEGEPLPFLEQYGKLLGFAVAAVLGTGGVVAWKKGWIGSRAAPVEAKKTEEKAPFMRCPECNASLREDRIVDHMLRVHENK